MGQRGGAGKSVGGNAKTGKELLFAAAEPGDGRSRGFEDIHLLEANPGYLSRVPKPELENWGGRHGRGI
jgi:hypothetical protein